MANSFSAETTYGQRAKLGLIVPPTNTVNEAEWAQMMPDGVTCHVTRMPLHADSSSEDGKKALYADIEKATSDLAQAGLSCIAYGCTAGSMVEPLNQLTDFMTSISGVSSVTTAASIVGALQALKLTKIAIATPYHDALNAHEVAFLLDNGVEALTIKGLGIGAGGPQEYIQIARTPADKILAHVLSVDHPDAEAIFISCTDFPTLALIPELETKLDKPVITSNQVTLWAALRAAGINDQFEGCGKILSSF
ncbi:MAG: decarboxylase [Rhodospirillaceae bacterium]|jgi:maleate cis-trans isomerase|nr:decarboxylase [Rhodospirillaceae bacterium]MBT4589350.1 decarboxylase [Rhodospirillaceae bacterium]MBT4940371.1 decarboxylase [Rhodospirillaceae bacterium]MBT5938587.1 decarboxylase [Rhodospirillaceae bacterium]MBT7266895.1 decarboxylase [Rhodospirillaceae bacterium]